jgi:hypothetical protein
VPRLPGRGVERSRCWKTQILGTECGRTRHHIRQKNIDGLNFNATVSSWSNRSQVVGERIHADVNGPMSVKSLRSAKYCVCYKND